LDGVSIKFKKKKKKRKVKKIQGEDFF